MDTEHENELDDDFTLLICECSSTEHQIIFMKDEDEEQIYCHIHLTPKPFFERLKNGIRYIFGHRSIYGDFDEIILSNKHKYKIKEIYDFLNKNNN